MSIEDRNFRFWHNSDVPRLRIGLLLGLLATDGANREPLRYRGTADAHHRVWRGSASPWTATLIDDEFSLTQLASVRVSADLRASCTRPDVRPNIADIDTGPIKFRHRQHADQVGIVRM